MAKKSKTDVPVCQFKITLRGSQPSIWRQFTVPASYTLGDLHIVIQAVMDWENYHLHEFVIGKTRYAMADDGANMFMETEMDGPSEDSVQLSDVAKRVKSKILYSYDFGDNWEHELELEKVLPSDTPAPRCLAGELAAPPEDCGGIWGYYDKLEIMENPSDPDYEDIREWIGDDFDPKAFSLVKINARLKRFRV